MIAKDTASLAKLLSDDFVAVHMTGTHQSKAYYLKAITGRTLNYCRADIDRIVF